MSNWLKIALERDLYVALITEPAAEQDTGSSIKEPSTGGYARKKIRFSMDEQGNAVLAKKIVWPNKGEESWSITGAAILDVAGSLIDFDNEVADATVIPGAGYELTELTISEKV